MRTSQLPALLLLAAACQAPVPKTTSLIGSADLLGWHADVPASDENQNLPASFAIEDGCLISRGQPEGHLISDSTYSHYRLDAEYRWLGEPGNCGILIHASEPRCLYGMFPASIEVQMHHGNAGDFWCICEDITVENMEARRGPAEKWGTREGAARRIQNLTDGSEKPVGDWNHMRIEVRGPRVDVWVNGDLVNQGYNCSKSSGQIAIQAEGAAVAFRRLDCTPLPE